MRISLNKNKTDVVIVIVACIVALLIFCVNFFIQTTTPNFDKKELKVNVYATEVVFNPSNPFGEPLIEKHLISQYPLDIPIEIMITNDLHKLIINVATLRIDSLGFVYLHVDTTISENCEYQHNRKKISKIKEELICTINNIHLIIERKKV